MHTRRSRLRLSTCSARETDRGREDDGRSRLRSHVRSETAADKMFFADEPMLFLPARQGSLKGLRVKGVAGSEVVNCPITSRTLIDPFGINERVESIIVLHHCTIVVALCLQQIFGREKGGGGV